MNFLSDFLLTLLGNYSWVQFSGAQKVLYCVFFAWWLWASFQLTQGFYDFWKKSAWPIIFYPIKLVVEMAVMLNLGTFIIPARFVTGVFVLAVAVSDSTPKTPLACLAYAFMFMMLVVGPIDGAEPKKYHRRRREKVTAEPLSATP